MMEDFLSATEDENNRVCKIWVKMWKEVDEKGHLVTKHQICGGKMEKTILSERPKITMYKCAKCGYGWRVHNGFKYPLDREDDDLYQDEIFDF